MCGTFYLFGSQSASFMLLAFASRRLYSVYSGQQKHQVENERWKMRLIGHREELYMITLWPLRTTQKEGVIFRACSSALSCYASFQFTSPTKKRRSEW
jgi:hypothetical protein